MNVLTNREKESVRGNYALNDRQLEILHLLYRFRCGTRELLALSTGVGKSSMNQRLQLLYKQGYVDRVFDESFRIDRKPAIYFLGKEGRAALRQVSPQYLPKVLRRLSRDKSRSDAHINHFLAILRTYTLLNSRYGDKLNFFTATQLEAYDYIPQPLPEAFIRIKVDGVERERLFSLYMPRPSDQPFVALRKVFGLIDYVDDGLEYWTDNTGREMPRVLFLFDTQSQLNYFVRKIRRAVYAVRSDLLEIYVATQGDIAQDEAAWRNVSYMDEKFAIHDITS